MRQFSVGLDYGTESARALVLDLLTGEEAAVATHRYRHGVMDRELPSGEPLPPLWALQHPGDYIEATLDLLARAQSEAQRKGGEILGIGVDFTASTVLPTTEYGTPLVSLKGFKDHPHAFAKLWKHHAAEPHAQAINLDNPYFLDYYGGKTSAEWSLAKAWQVLEEAPEIWEATQRWIDAGDWIVWQLVGEEVRSTCQAGYKNHWQPEWGGYPDRQALERIRMGLGTWLDRLASPQPAGSVAGRLTRNWAEYTGIKEGIPVAVATIDAHAAVPGMGIFEPGVLALVLGTSTCHLALSADVHPEPGIEGVVPGGILPGYYGYQTGQPATGDMLKWWVGTLAWAGGETEEALFERLNRGASKLEGPTGMVVLDWWNGCRTPLMDSDLQGVITGLGLNVTPVELYKAMLEATAYGTLLAIETLEPAVGKVREIRATGGLSQTCSLMQLYADILGREVHASTSPNGSARGAAVYGGMCTNENVTTAQEFKSYEPRPIGKEYEAYYQRYRRLARILGMHAGSSTDPQAS